MHIYDQVFVKKTDRRLKKFIKINHKIYFEFLENFNNCILI